MCGIAGYMGKGNEKILENMVQSIRHRGPDNQGFEIIDNVGLGHARLSILDLSPLGHQPMWNEDKTIAIVFNGEIYNFQEIRNKKTYKSGTDTEVILGLYEEFGEKVFEKIHGMFAIAIYDRKKKKIILARDRMGKKPLYWGIHNATFLFASELKSLMMHPDFKKEIDIESLNKYLFYEYVPTPYSIFKNTYKLEPGTYLVWDGKNISKNTYWKPNFDQIANNLEDSLVKLDKALDQSVKDRLVADVPVGIFLSGGLDSSLVSYYANKYKKIKTFSIGFKEKSFDESKYARQVAIHLGTDHHEKIVDSSSLQILPEIIDILDEPIADASIIPTYLLSKFAKEHVTVALGGDGGDELFAGYDTFTAHRFSNIYAKLPFKRFIKKIISFIPTSFSNMSLDFKIKKFVNDFEGDPETRNQRWLSPFSDVERKNILQEYYTDFDMPKYENILHEYQRGYMMDQVLVKVDRASMAHSLEVRAPLLDTRVVELANSLPFSFKLKGLQKKFILKKLMKGKIPDRVIYRKKKGFGIPIAEWIRGDLKDLVLNSLNKKILDEIGLFNAEYIEKIVDEHMKGKKDNRKQIWTILIFALWWRKWVK